jgi:hypothetical protein
MLTMEKLPITERYYKIRALYIIEKEESLYDTKEL